MVYMTNLKSGYRKTDQNDKKPAAENMLIEEPTLNNLNHINELYGESGSDYDNIEDSLKGENKKNSKEEDYTNMDEKKEGK